MSNDSFENESDPELGVPEGECPICGRWFRVTAECDIRAHGDCPGGGKGPACIRPFFNQGAVFDFAYVGRAIEGAQP